MMLRNLGRAAALTIAAVAGCKGEPAPTGPAASSPAALTASPDRIPAGVTAVQNEMRLLHEAMRDAVTAIADDDLARIGESLHRVHRARELTDKALHSKEYKLPKNAENVAAFIAKDEAFHDELEKLFAAAKSKDTNATSVQLGVVLSRCSDCHTQFRR